MSKIDVSNKNGFYCIEPCIELQQLKAENEQLKKCENFAIIDQAKRLYKLNKCLDEIEELCKVHTDFCKDNKKDCELCPHEPCEDIIILQKIKEVKGNE